MKSPLYVPIVKGKRNDLIAVGKLSRHVRECVKPLVEAMPVNRKKTNVDDHVHQLCQYVRKHVPLGNLFVDFFGLMPEDCASDGTNATIFGYQLLKGLGRYVTPVYGIERNNELWTSLREVVEGFGQGFAFRLHRDDLADDLIDETWGAIIERAAQLGLKEESIDIILDFGSLSELDPVEVREATVSFLSGNPRVRNYRSIVVASSSALRTVSEVEKEGVAEIVREELHLWSDLWNDLPDEVRPVYGDYGIVHPDFSDMGPNKYMNAKIRYTVGNKILYFRGHGLLHPQKDFEQYQELAQKVKADARCRSESFSFGDGYLASCAKGHISPGAPATWVKADMNHHITYVALQINRLISAFELTSDFMETSTLLEEV